MKMKRMFFEWVMWQIEVSNIRMGLTTLDIAGDYVSRRAMADIMDQHVRNMLKPIGK